MNSLSIEETMHTLSAKAKNKSQLSLAKLILLGIMAGGFIALGYLAFIRVSATMPKEWGSFSTLLGAGLFPIGLIGITFLGGELVTGNGMTMMFGLLEKKVSFADVIRNWTLVLLTNIVGGLLVAYFFGHVVGLTEGDFAAKTMSVALGKLADSPVQMLLSGIGCNIFVCMAVYLATMSKDIVGKMFGIWFPIMIFVVCGFQHVVANAFILPAGFFAGADISLADMLKNIFFVFVGNEIGGSIFLALPVYLSVSKPADELNTENVKEQVVHE
ncbi:MAG TPA: formate/nitrite transporter family protein [Tetragenococcus sp.]|nr:formate/nitrite transporter family protein [Tetragenococcus sp.]